MINCLKTLFLCFTFLSFKGAVLSQSIKGTLLEKLVGTWYVRLKMEKIYFEEIDYPSTATIEFTNMNKFILKELELINGKMIALVEQHFTRVTPIIL